MSAPWTWFSSEAHIDTGRLCAAGSRRDRVPRRPRSYAALRLPASVGHGSGSPCQWPPSMQALVLCRRHVRSPTCRASATGHRLSARPGWVEERRGPPRCLGRPLRPCHGRTPRRIRASPHPRHGEAVVAFKSFSTLGLREGERVRGRIPHGPHVRMPPHRRCHFWHRRKAGYRLGRAHPWPGRIRTCWTTNKVSWRHRILQFPLTHRAWSHYFTYPIGFMTHSLSQVFESPLGALLEEACPTRFYLPNPSAMEPKIHAIYSQIGLTPQAIRTIATARPQRDVYYACMETGQRLFHLPLDPVTLACVARNRAEDHALMDDLLVREG